MNKAMARFITFIVHIGLGSVLCVSLSSCLMGPGYLRPEISTPAQWEQDSSKVGNIAMVTDQLPEARWWEAFKNPELNRLIERALLKNHEVRQAAARILEGRATIRAAGAGLYPQAHVNTGYTRTRRSETILVAPTSGAPLGFAPPGTTFDIWNAVVDLRWELDLWGRIRRGKEAAKAEAFSREYDHRGVILSLISDLGEAYFRLRALDEEIEITQKNLALRQDALAIIRSRGQVGLSTELDVKRAEVLVAETASDLPALQRARTIQLHHIEVLVGDNPQTLRLEPQALRQVIAQPDIPIGLPSQLLERRPDILEAEQLLMAANARIGEARAHFFPTISITGQGGFQSSEFAQWFQSGSRTYNIGPSITLPIFQGGTNVARLQVAESRHIQMLEQYQQTILNAFREVADLLVSIQGRTEQRDRQREQVAAAQTAFELAALRYQEGLVTFLDVVDANRTVLEAETQLLQTERARLTDMVILFKALGGGWQHDPELMLPS